VKIRYPLRALLGLFMLASPACFAEAPNVQRKMNVLFIVSDDLGNYLGTYGEPVKSPNLDALAARGVRFDRAYCQYPLCGPSRCSFMSGLRPDTIGVFKLNLPVRYKLKNVVTLPQVFRNNGYFSARVGKIYHLGIPDGVGTPGNDDPPSWDHTFDPKGAEFTTDGEDVDPNPKNGQSFRYVMGNGNGAEQADYQIADEAIRLLDANRDKPFFLAVGFIRPHVPEIAPRRFFDLYPIDQIALPPVAPEGAGDIPPIALKNSRYNNFGMNPQQCRESIRAYRAATSFMDAQAGRVLDELKKLGLDRNTVITFVGDHGYSLGQHRMWQKMALFEPVARVPFIIAAPSIKPGATRSIAEMIDLFPTITELCGLPTPREVQGKSLVPVLKDNSTVVKAAAYTQLNRARQKIAGRSVRSDRWRYTEWDGGKAGIELYDEQSDPQEMHNLAKDSKQAKTLASLKRLLHAQDQSP
jgi:uncharacterized sulfatase